MDFKKLIFGLFKSEEDLNKLKRELNKKRKRFKLRTYKIEPWPN